MRFEVMYLPSTQYECDPDVVYGGRATSFMDGLLMAQEAISNGRAYQKLEELVEMTNC